MALSKVFITCQLPGGSLEGLRESAEVEAWPRALSSLYHVLQRKVAGVPVMLCLVTSCIKVKLLCAGFLKAIIQMEVGMLNIQAGIWGEHMKYPADPVFAMAECRCGAQPQLVSDACHSRRMDSAGKSPVLSARAALVALRAPKGNSAPSYIAQVIVFACTIRVPSHML